MVSTVLIIKVNLVFIILVLVFVDFSYSQATVVPKRCRLPIRHFWTKFFYYYYLQQRLNWVEIVHQMYVE